MSVPKNHHYVSQCHQKEFFNNETGRIYLYDKERDNFYSKQSTKRLFSEEFLNSRATQGRIDHLTLEYELKALFEDDFAIHVKKVESFIESQEDMQGGYEALCWLMLLGILGELRHPDFKYSLDKTMTALELDILTKATGLDKKVIAQYIVKKRKTPYDNQLSYITTALRILERMEPLDFEIYYIKSNDHFLLPDTSCIQRRGQLKNYPNAFIKEIIQVGVPITDKIFILGTPQTLKTDLHGIHYIGDDNSAMVFNVNKNLYDFAKKGVACRDEHFLKITVEKIKSVESSDPS
jgi:hypothetical protein